MFGFNLRGGQRTSSMGWSSVFIKPSQAAAHDRKVEQKEIAKKNAEQDKKDAEDIFEIKMHQGNEKAKEVALERLSRKPNLVKEKELLDLLAKLEKERVEEEEKAKQRQAEIEANLAAEREAERVAAEEAAKKAAEEEAARVAAEEAAKKAAEEEAARVAAEEAAKKAAEEEAASAEEVDEELEKVD